MNERLAFLRKKAMALPLNPGVYIMKNKKNEIIYIGKAKLLKNRVSQYFGSQSRHTVKVLKMVENVYDFDYILTDSEFEALVLECSLIKQHMPKYNILLKDDKGYHYIKITKEKWPKITAEKQMLNDGAEYIGPYTGAFSVNQAVEEATKIFRLPVCGKQFPRDIHRNSRPCLNYFIKRCSAPCAGKITCTEYNEAIEQAVDFLKGGSRKALKRMNEEMEQAAENLQFEKAASLRDRISAIEKINEKQKVVANNVEEQDVFAVVQSEKTFCLMVLRFTDGRLSDSEHFFLEPDKDLPQLRHEFLMGYYSMHDRVPRRITVDGEVSDIELITRWLSEKAGRKVTVAVPERGEQAKILEMCRSNAAEKLAQKLGRGGKETSALDELARLLGLDKIPRYIEAYDISHTAGSDNVGGMVVFFDGQPYKKAYKRFSIKGFEGQDDYASMAEVLTRRFKHYYEESPHSNEGFGRLPDLILLDGGQGQVNAVMPVMKYYNLNVPVFGMVKDDKHRTRAIAQNGGEIAINSKRQVFTLVSDIQEEVHRWAIGYHRKKHTKKLLTYGLTDIKGIGEKTAVNLLKALKTIDTIMDADVETLKCVKGVTQPQAEAIYKYFHPDC